MCFQGIYIAAFRKHFPWFDLFIAYQFSNEDCIYFLIWITIAHIYQYKRYISNTKFQQNLTNYSTLKIWILLGNMPFEYKVENDFHY